MSNKQGKRSLITGLIILGAILIVFAGIGIARLLWPAKEDPYTQNTTNVSTQTTEPEVTDTPAADEPADTNAAPSTDTSNETSTVDPATLNSIDIEPLTISVSYVKGVGGFEYQVLRAANGTRYVEFSSPELVGTKCTNDMGVFVSILVSPTENDSSTVAKTVTVDDTKYGLSLADENCTSDVDKLKAYQKSFSDGFSNLKKIE